MNFRYGRNTPIILGDRLSVEVSEDGTVTVYHGDSAVLIGTTENARELLHSQGYHYEISIHAHGVAIYCYLDGGEIKTWRAAINQTRLPR